MNNMLKINFGKRKRLTSLLGLALDGSRLEGVVLRRTNGVVATAPDLFRRRCRWIR